MKIKKSEFPGIHTENLPDCTEFIKKRTEFLKKLKQAVLTTMDTMSQENGYEAWYLQQNYGHEITENCDFMSINSINSILWT